MPALFIYRGFLSLLFQGIRIASVFSEKARLWATGRDKPIPTLEPNPGKRIWFHCASLGEYEQARPLIELINEQHPNADIVLTFFSPSGYEISKNLPYTYVGYIPEDTCFIDSGFIQKIKPDLAFFIRYELWYYTLSELHKNNIPTFLACAYIRPESIFFKPWGSLHRKMLDFFTQIFVQDKTSAETLNKIGRENVQICGDTRLDRVISLARTPFSDFELESFCSGKTLIAGSIWPEDVPALEAFLTHPDLKEWKVVCFPHQLNDHAIREWIKTWGVVAALSGESKDQTRLLIINRMGLLSRAYRYGEMAYVGGGFGHAVHNVIEPAVYGLGIVCGPAISRSLEIAALSNVNALITINHTADLPNAALKLTKREKVGESAKKYVEEHAGASMKIIDYLHDLHYL